MTPNLFSERQASGGVMFRWLDADDCEDSGG